MSSTSATSETNPESDSDSNSNSRLSKNENMAFAIYLIGLVVAIWGLGPRLAAERHHRTTEIVVDASALEQWVAESGEEGQALPGKLLESKISSLAVAELHLDDLVERGALVAQSQSEFFLMLASGALGSVEGEEVRSLEASAPERSGGTYLVFLDRHLVVDLLPQLKILFGPSVDSHLDGRVVWLPTPGRTLRTLGLGFDRSAIEEYHARGFSIWLRPENRVGLSQARLEALFQVWETLPGVQGVVFGGGSNEALGYPDLLETSVQEFRRLGWKVGYVELPERAQQKGIETTVRELPGQTVRVMAVSPAHQAKLAPFRVLGMYSLGSRERNIRLLYVRPYAVPGRTELDQEFLFSLSSELEQNGPASLFAESENKGPGQVLTAIISFSAAALAVMVLLQMGMPFQKWWWGLCLLSPVLALLAEALGKGMLFRSLLALAVGVAAPTYAFLRWVYPSLDASGTEPGILSGVRGLLLTSLMSLSGGLYLASFLSDTTFLLGLDRFRGVKLLTLGTPILIVGAFLVKRYSAQQWLQGLRAHIAVYQAVLAGGLAIVLGFLYLRTGNDAGGAASESERTLRVLLDRALGVRPRFKEFMMAHPALVCAPLFARKTGFLPTLVLVLLAGIGQAGIVDTFAHIHTPLYVTLIRITLGVGLGAVMGALTIGFYRLVGPAVEGRIRGLGDLK
jgi:Family of unknown function (DUF5693)